MSIKKHLQYHLPGILLFLFALVVGLCVYRDYGVSWDEPIQRNLGLVTYDYVSHGKKDLLSYQDRNYGAAFELLLVMIEKSMRGADLRNVYFMRHLVAHIFFLVGALSFYVLSFRLFKNRFIACLGFLLIICMPRIYAHSFFNSKDVPFMSMFVIALTFCQYAFEKHKLTLFVVAGFVSGLVAGIRIMGVMLLVLVAVFLIADIINSAVMKKKPYSVFNLLGFSFAFCLSLYITWPYLWADPLGHFVESFQVMSRYPATGVALLNGSYFQITKLPWFYFPLWFSVTVPALYILAGVMGAMLIIAGFFNNSLQFLFNAERRLLLLSLLGFLLPVLSVISLHSVLYNEWRHLYFVYPFFVLMALYAINSAMGGRFKAIVVAACILQVICTGWFMVVGHPYQQVYFNSFVSHAPEYLNENFELEYWGCSFKQGLEHLLSSHKSDTIRIAYSVPPLTNNMLILKPGDRQRIVLTDDMSRADYILISSRANRRHEFAYTGVEYDIKVQGSSIMCIYKLH